MGQTCEHKFKHDKKFAKKEGIKLANDEVICVKCGYWPIDGKDNMGKVSKKKARKALRSASTPIQKKMNSSMAAARFGGIGYDPALDEDDDPVPGPHHHIENPKNKGSVLAPELYSNSESVSEECVRCGVHIIKVSGVWVGKVSQSTVCKKKFTHYAKPHQTGGSSLDNNIFAHIMNRKVPPSQLNERAKALMSERGYMWDAMYCEWRKPMTTNTCPKAPPGETDHIWEPDYEYAQKKNLRVSEVSEFCIRCDAERTPEERLDVIIILNSVCVKCDKNISKQGDGPWRATFRSNCEHVPRSTLMPTPGLYKNAFGSFVFLAAVGDYAGTHKKMCIYQVCADCSWLVCPVDEWAGSFQKVER